MPAFFAQERGAIHGKINLWRGSVPLMIWSKSLVIKFRAIAAVLLLAITLVPSVAMALPSTPQAFPSATWAGWAAVAWRYWNNCYNAATGLTFDSCTWRFFALWGLGSNILGLVAAHKIGGLVSDSNFNFRVDQILDFLNNMTLTGTGAPYLIYSSDTGSAQPAFGVTDSADYGKLLIAEYVLKEHLLTLSDATRAGRVDSAVNHVNNNNFFLSADLYGYYASLGFLLWGLQPGFSVTSPGAVYAVQGSQNSTTIKATSRTADALSGFQNLMENGPFVPSTSMYGVSGVPAKTRIDAEPFVDAILEVGDQPFVVGLPSWNDFTTLGVRVYQAQEGRHSSTGKPEFWTGGGLDFSPGFVSEWIVWTTGATWVVLDGNGNTFTSSKVPVAYAKLMFGYSALYDTTYTTSMLNTYASQLITSQGFREGVYRDGTFDTNVQIQTNQIILDAASYVILDHTVPIGQSQPTFSLSCTGGLPSGATCSLFNPTSGPLPLDSILTISTSPSTPVGCYSVTVKATGGIYSATTKVTLGVVLSSQGVEGMGPYVKNACARTVYFVLPDYAGPMHQPAAKCGGVNAAALSDYSAGGYVLGLLKNQQNQVLDTSSTISQTSCGNPSSIGGGGLTSVVTLAGPGVNELVHYYEQVAGIAPVFFLWDGTRNNFIVRSTGVNYTVPNGAGNTLAGDDLFLIETFADGPTRLVFTLYGFSWQGTLAAGVFFSSFMSPQLAQFQNAWYIYRWQDASSGTSHNSFPDPADVYTLLATSGTPPSLSPINNLPSGSPSPGFAGIIQDVLGAGKNTTYFVLPDYAGVFHSSAAKCGGVSAAALSDYSAGGYLLSATTNYQYEVLDTSNSVNLTTASCGLFLSSTSVIVTVAGPGVNTVVHYYEVSATSPVFFLWDGSRNNFVVRGTGTRYKVPNAGGMTTSGDDLFLLESFIDGQGRHVYVIYGFSWQGTLAAATFLNIHAKTDLSSFTKSWYIYEWKDASSGSSANSFPDQSDTYNLVASG